MCWNPDISINTFIFACVALLFILITNTFTKYKTPFFNNPFVYFFLFAIASMQLIEFFLWRNLKNAAMNKILSIIASFFICLQQITLIIMIPDLTIRYGLLVFYAIFLTTYFEYKRIYNPIQFHTSVGKNGHLSWDWMNYKGYENIWLIIGLLFYILPVLAINKISLTVLIIPWLFLSFWGFIITTILLEQCGVGRRIYFYYTL